MKKKMLVFALLALSCNRPAFRQSVDFDDSRWMRGDVRTFDFDVPDGGNYDISVNFSHVYGAPVTEIPLDFTLSGKDGKLSLHPTLRLVGQNGESLSDCAGDVCDFTQKILENKKLSPGHYKISLGQRFDYAYLPNAIAVGIEVRRPENQ
jgi:hypothetical protein